MSISQNTFTPSKTARSTRLPTYEDISGAIIIGPDGKYKTLSPEEEAARQKGLEQAVREKMLGLPKTTIFEWHAMKLYDQPPSYTPGQEKDACTSNQSGRAAKTLVSNEFEV